METSVVVQNEGLANKFNLKSEAVTVIVGETLAALEAQKQQLMDKLPAAKKALGDANTKCGEAVAEQAKAEEAKAEKWPIAVLYRKAMAAANNCGNLALNVDTTSVGGTIIVSLTLGLKTSAEYRHLSGLTVAQAEIGFNAQTRAAIAAKDAAAKALVELTQEITKLDTEINRLPHTKMLIEASVAKQSLLSTEAGREVYAAAQESLQAMAGKDLRATLALGPASE
jgi:hypothetical protein